MHHPHYPLPTKCQPSSGQDPLLWAAPVQCNCRPRVFKFEIPFSLSVILHVIVSRNPEFTSFFPASLAISDLFLAELVSSLGCDWRALVVQQVHLKTPMKQFL